MIDAKKAIGLAVLGLAVVIGVISARGFCTSKIKIEIVRGGSLSGVVEDGESVKVQDGYYDCHPVRRNDIAVYKYAGNSNPLIKIVKGGYV